MEKEADRPPVGRETTSGRHSKEKRRSEHRDDDDDMHSLSSIFSDSDKSMNNDEFGRKHSKDRPRSPVRKRSRSPHRDSRDGAERSRTEPTYLQHKQAYSRSKTTGSSQATRPTTGPPHDEKKPIKIEFMRKQSSLKKGDEFESGGEESDQNDEFSLYGNSKDVVITKSSAPAGKTATAASTPASREELLKRLKEIDEAIARKRSKV